MSTDPRLQAIASFAEYVTNTVNKRAKKEFSSLEWSEIRLPSVTCFMSGYVITGDPISQKSYFRRIRKKVEHSSNVDANGLLFLSKIIEDPLKDAEEDEGAREDQWELSIEYKRIYLADCFILMGTQSFNLDEVRIETDAITGWTLGKMSQP